MRKVPNYIETVGKLIQECERLGFTPVLVGGMALVVLGSRRVTRDFDFLIAAQAREQKELLEIFYKSGLELASKIDEQGNVIVTIDNPRVAAVRLHLDAPESAHFFNRKTGLQVDLLFDFPLSAHEIASRAQTKKIRSYVFRIACKEDLLQLKKIAKHQRTFAGDVQDLEFLEKMK